MTVEQRKRRRWFGRWQKVLLLVFASLGVWAFWIEPSRLVVHEVNLDWPQGRGRLRIALISDLHVGSLYTGIGKVRKVVDTINAASPDVVLIAGDFVPPRVPVPPEEIAGELQRLRPRFGTFAVLGNNDWWSDGIRIQKALESKGIRVLENSAVRVENGAGSFWVGGLADMWTRQMDIDATLAAVTDDAPVFLLTHNPDCFPRVPPRVSLVLAGHTHGGQVRFPLIGAPVVPSDFGQRFVRGLIEENGRRMYVTTGVGTSIIPVRFGVPPEVVILNLTGNRSP